MVSPYFMERSFLHGAPPSLIAIQSVFLQALVSGFLSRLASRNCSIGLEETLLDGVVNASATVDSFSFFSSHDRLTESKLFYSGRAIYWACAGKQKKMKKNSV